MAAVGLTVQAFPPVFSQGVHEQDNRRTHALAQPVPVQMDQVVQDSPISMGGSLPSLFTPVSGTRRSGRGMRPAGRNSRSPKKLSGDYVVTDNGFDALRGDEDEDGSQFDIVTIPEIIVCPDAGGGG